MVPVARLCQRRAGCQPWCLAVLSGLLGSLLSLLFSLWTQIFPRKLVFLGVGVQGGVGQVRD